MIDAATISRAVETAFKADPAFNAFTVERSEWVNENPSRCPWLGIYRGGMDYSPETLGNGPDYWTGAMTLRLMVQAANYESGAAVEDELEGYVRDVIGKVFSDTTIRGSVDMVTGVSVNYSYIAEDSETLYFQAAIIELNLEVSTA